jgi:hypothetical protein
MARPSFFTLARLRTVIALLAAALLCTHPAVAANYDFTDTWWNPVESGWGVNFTQADDNLFATFFIYGADKNPTWYTGQMTWDGTSQFGGKLYATKGSHFAGPWIPAEHPDAVLVGTVSFVPNTANNYQGTLTYTVNGVGTVTKAIQRQYLGPILLAGNYVGGEVGGYSGCSPSSVNSNYNDSFTLNVAQTGGSVSMTFRYPATGTLTLTCAFAGTLVQNGTVFSIDSATFQCSDGLKTNASIRNLKATPLGIEGQFSAPSVGSGCRQDAQFGGTLQ